MVDAVTLPVAEVFGPTFQGEGPYTGTRCGFVRLGLCNLACEWCDTPYTWDHTRYDVAAECPPATVEEIHARVARLDVDTVVLSGGEPLIHARHLQPLLDTVRWTWHAETNGTIPPPAWWGLHVRHTTVSPKINTTDLYRKRIKPRALAGWLALAHRDQACFKFVATDAFDLDAVAHVVDLVGIPAQSVWVMPEGTEPGVLVKRHQDLQQHVLDRGWNTTTRLHILLYGSERGR